MLFRLAETGNVAAVRAFFTRNLPPGSDSIYTSEFYCPDGVKAAIQRRQLMLALAPGKTAATLKIAAAARFYPKKNGEFTLYQFAVDPAFRGQGLARALFDAIRGGQPMRSLCPASSDFNRYYERGGWRLEHSANAINHWVLEAETEANGA